MRLFNTEMAHAIVSPAREIENEVFILYKTSRSLFLWSDAGFSVLCACIRCIYDHFDERNQKIHHI